SRFKSPRAIAVDALGTVYVADDARIRCISPNGMVTTRAGSEPGCLDGPAATAQFDTLSGLALDRVGNLYLADAGNRRLRKLSRDGQVTTLPVGPDAQTDTPILHPVAVCVGPDGTLYVLDVADFSLKAVLPGGQVVRIAGDQQGNSDGDEKTAKFWMPTALAHFNDRLYVTDREQHAIRLVRLYHGASPLNVALEGPTEQFGAPPAPEDSKQTKPSVAVIVPQPGTVVPHGVPPFAAQAGLTTTDLDDLVVEVVTGRAAGLVDGVGAVAQLNHPVGLALDAEGVLYIADHFNHAIRKLTPDGYLQTVAGGHQRGFRDGRGNEAEFNGPLGIAVGRQGEVYVADHLNARVRVVTPDGEVRTLAGTGVPTIEDGPVTAASFEGPKGLAVDMHGIVYVTDGVVVRVITPDGQVQTLAGQARGFRDGIGARAMFGWVYAITLDVSGRCYVTDAANHAIRCVFPDGTVKTVFGGGQERQLNFPNGLSADVFGNLYVADTNHHRVLRLTPTGTDTYTAALICGQRRGRQTGPAREAELDAPRGIVVGFHHDLYVADSNANRILRVRSVRLESPPSPSHWQAAPLSAAPLSVAADAQTPEGALSEAETVSESLSSLALSSRPSSAPADVAAFTKETEHGAAAQPSELSSTPPLSMPPSQPVLVQPSLVSPATPPASHPRHVAATVLGWGVELSGNNLIRTEPDGSLLLDTTYSAENSAFFYLPWDVTAEQKVVIEVRMQLVAYVGERDATGCAIWFENDRHADALLIQPEGIRLLRVPTLAYACNPCAGINTYTIVLHGADLRIGFNGVARIHGDGKFWSRPAARDGRPLRRWLAFGDGSSSAGSISRWQRVTYQVIPPDSDTLPL
ncbi:MAG: NHL repeat-containing protein, partial [Chloracidobacterium sp.]